jgi:hypothetical protein
MLIIKLKTKSVTASVTTNQSIFNHPELELVVVVITTSGVAAKNWI